MRDIQPLPNANVRAQTYYVARTDARCRHCGLATRLLALALPQDHESLIDESQAEPGDGSEPASDAWQRAGVNAFLFYVDHLPAGVQDRLRQLLQFFRPASSASTMNSYWANHCEHCGTAFSDHELHCEPDGAFVPTSEAAAISIRLLEVQAPFEAAAAGYAIQPEFFASMRRS